MNLSTTNGLDLCLGSGLYRFRLSIHGRHGYLLRVPLLGKMWSYAGGNSGRTGWAGVGEEHRQGLTD